LQQFLNEPNAKNTYFLSVCLRCKVDIVLTGSNAQKHFYTQQHGIGLCRSITQASNTGRQKHLRNAQAIGAISHHHPEVSHNELRNGKFVKSIGHLNMAVKGVK